MWRGIFPFHYFTFDLYPLCPHDLFKRDHFLTAYRFNFKAHSDILLMNLSIVFALSDVGELWKMKILSLVIERKCHFSAQSHTEFRRDLIDCLPGHATDLGGRTFRIPALVQRLTFKAVIRALELHKLKGKKIHNTYKWDVSKF